MMRRALSLAGWVALFGVTVLAVTAAVVVGSAAGAALRCSWVVTE